MRENTGTISAPAPKRLDTHCFLLTLPRALSNSEAHSAFACGCQKFQGVNTPRDQCLSVMVWSKWVNPISFFSSQVR